MLSNSAKNLPRSATIAGGGFCILTFAIGFLFQSVGSYQLVFGGLYLIYALAIAYWVFQTSATNLRWQWLELTLTPVSLVLIWLSLPIFVFLFTRLAILPPSFIANNETILRWPPEVEKRYYYFGFLLLTISIVLIRFWAGSFAPTQGKTARSVTNQVSQFDSLWQIVFPEKTSIRLMWAFVGLILGAGYFGAEIFLNTMLPEFHLNVLLGQIAAIDQGRIPVVEAHTQYGLGNQLILYRLMKYWEFSYAGAFVAQDIVNAITISVFFGFLFWFTGPVIGVASLFTYVLVPSPMKYYDLPGWAWFTRWAGIAINAMLFAEVLFMQSKKRLLWIVFPAVLAGVFSYLSQESLVATFIVVAVIVGYATGTKFLSFSEAVLLSGVFFVVNLVVYLGAVAMTVGIGNVPEALYLMGYHSRLITEGMTASHPLRSVWAANFYRFNYVAFPLMALLLTFTATDVSKDQNLKFHKIFLGIFAGAFSLHFLTMIRADLGHLSAPSYLLAPFFYCVLFCFYRLVSLNVKSVLAVLLFFCVPLMYGGVTQYGELAGLLRNQSNFVRSAALVQDKLAHMTELREINQTLGLSERTVAQRISLDLDEYERIMPTMGGYEYVADLTDIAAFTRNRPTLFIESGGGHNYFVAGLNVGSSIIDPVGSMWLESDYDWWKATLEIDQPECMFTRHADHPIAIWILEKQGLEDAELQPFGTDYLGICF